MEMKRREFLGTGAAIGVGSLVGGTSVFGDEKSEKKPKNKFSDDPLAIVSITDKVKATRIGFGTGMRGSMRQSNITRMDRKEALELLKFAYDQGIRLFDMADLYGSHPIVAEALAGKPREELTFVTKIWDSRGGIPEQERLGADEIVKRFLKELKTDYLDIVQIHCMANDRWPVEHARQLELLEKCKEEGLIRAHGVSTHSNAALEAALKTPWTDVVHIRINSEGANMDGGPEATEAMSRKVHEAGIGTIAMKVVGEGKFTDKADIRKKSIAYVSGLDCIDAMVVGFDKKEHITDFISLTKTALTDMKAKM